MKTAAVLLAAGRGSRFGAPKLAAQLGGKPLAYHAAETLRQLSLVAHIAVTAKGTPDLATLGFDCVPLDPPDGWQSRSLAQGVARATAAGADRVLVVLADMPFVPLEHFEALLASADDAGIASVCAGQTMPPALFGPARLPALLGLAGDQGARALLRDLPNLALAPEHALDIDTPDDLQRAQRYLDQIGSG